MNDNPVSVQGRYVVIKSAKNTYGMRLGASYELTAFEAERLAQQILNAAKELRNKRGG
jgi:hypothetical protein